jgi:2-polyprenyl-3-methyl-5-hydroxy-6-metoxy-1,4-benzoquinol methylase
MRRTRSNMDKLDKDEDKKGAKEVESDTEEDKDEEQRELKELQDSEIIDTMGQKREYKSMPKKTKYRMRAHINPLNEPSWPIPLSQEYVDWSLHYPAFYDILDNNDDKVYCNTTLYPITYAIKPEADKSECKVTILDIGCGYGNLLLELSKEFPDKLTLGMEIRDKVTEF